MMEIYLLIVNTWKHYIPISTNDLRISIKWTHPNRCFRSVFKYRNDRFSMIGRWIDRKNYKWGIQIKVQRRIPSVLAAKADTYILSWIVGCCTNIFDSISIILLWVGLVYSPIYSQKKKKKKTTVTNNQSVGSWERFFTKIEPNLYYFL